MSLPLSTTTNTGMLIFLLFLAGMSIYYWTERGREVVKVEAEPLMVDVDEQEYRVRFTVRKRKEGLPASLLEAGNDILVARIEARTATGWRYLGEETSSFNYGAGTSTSSYERPAQQRRAQEAVEAFLAKQRRGYS